MTTKDKFIIVTVCLIISALAFKGLECFYPNYKPFTGWHCPKCKTEYNSRPDLLIRCEKCNYQFIEYNKD